LALVVLVGTEREIVSSFILYGMVLFVSKGQNYHWLIKVKRQQKERESHCLSFLRIHQRREQRRENVLFALPKEDKKLHSCCPEKTESCVRVAIRFSRRFRCIFFSWYELKPLWSTWVNVKSVSWCVFWLLFLYLMHVCEKIIFWYVLGCWFLYLIHIGEKIFSWCVLGC